MESVITPDNLAAFASLVVDAARDGKWPVFAALLLVAVVWAARKWGAPKVPFLATPEGGTLLNFATSFAGAIATALIGGVSFTWGMAWAAVQVSFLAAGGWGVLKSLVFPMLLKIPALAALFQAVSPDAEAKAKLAGEKAVKDAAIKTASDLINKP